MSDLTSDVPTVSASAENADPTAQLPTEEDDRAQSGKTADEELAEMFGSMKKKKKSSKKTQFAVDLDNLPAPRTSQMTAAAEKKQAAEKKEAKESAEAVEEEKADEVAAAAAAAAPAKETAPKSTEGSLDFGELKKKKKSSKGSKKLAEFEKELAEAEAADAEDAAGAADGDSDDEPAGEDGVDRTAEGDLGDDPFAQDGGADGGDGTSRAGAGASKGDAGGAWIGSDRDYVYSELLGRIFDTLRAHNPALSGDKKKYTIVPPSVHREGSKKTLFANSLDICKRMHREPEHVYSFLFAELGTIGNVDGNQRLIIKGRFQPKQIENVLRKYIVEYVTCRTCKSPNTVLSKKDRIYFMTCSTCGSSRSVSAIKTGFQAITGKRSKLRAA